MLIAQSETFWTRHIRMDWVWPTEEFLQQLGYAVGIKAAGFPYHTYCRCRAESYLGAKTLHCRYLSIAAMKDRRMAMEPAFSCRKMMVGCALLCLTVQPWGYRYQAQSFVPSAASKITSCVAKGGFVLKTDTQIIPGCFISRFQIHPPPPPSPPPLFLLPQVCHRFTGKTATSPNVCETCWNSPKSGDKAERWITLSMLNRDTQTVLSFSGNHRRIHSVSFLSCVGVPQHRGHSLLARHVSGLAYQES